MKTWLAMLMLILPLVMPRFAVALTGLPYLTQVDESARAGQDSGGKFTYTYRLRNGEGSAGRLTRFQVDIRQPSDGIALRADALVDTPGRMVGMDIPGSPRTPPLVPVGYPNVPSGWIAGPTVRGTADWGAFGESFPLPPGSDHFFLELQSWGLPTVRDFRADPRFNLDLHYPSADTLDEEELKRVNDQLVVDREVVAFKGKTIGPTAPPKVFDPLKFTEYIIDLKNQSVELGWIKDQTAANTFDQQLQSIRAEAAFFRDQQLALIRGEKILSLGAQFLQFVESNSCKEFDCADPRPLTSEAYALLFYNMDYFRSQVRQACGIPAPLPSQAPKRPSPPPKRK